MAQVGDTITYTFSGSPVSEDVSDVEEIEILYCEAGADQFEDNAGGRVENVVVDTSNESTLYIWVGEQGVAADSFGRYDGKDGLSSSGGAGSSEVSLLPTDSGDSATEPFIVGAGGAGGDSSFAGEADGARGGTAEGQPPPRGGKVGGDIEGEGAVAGHGSTATIIDSGTTIKGGGPTDANGEIKIAYRAGLKPPDPPSNLTAEVQ